MAIEFCNQAEKGVNLSRNHQISYGGCTTMNSHEIEKIPDID